MYKLFSLELKKLKGTFLNILLPIIFVMPLLLVLVQYYTSRKAVFSETIAKSSAFLQMISFAGVVISGCYIITREYKSNMAPYLEITPNSMTGLLFCKSILLFFETLVLQLAIFTALICINTVVAGFDGETAAKLFFAGIISTLFLSSLIPAVTFIALWRKSFSGASIIFLVLFMLTYPLSFMRYGSMFPHLVPIMLVAKFLGNSQYSHTSYAAGSLSLLLTFAVFLYLSVYMMKKKR